MRKFTYPLGLLIIGLLFSIKQEPRKLENLLILEGEDTLAIGGKLKNPSKRDLILIPGVGDKLASEILKTRTLIDAKGVGRKTEIKLKRYIDKKHKQYY